MTYIPGDYYVICDLSGKKILRSQAVKQWNGLIVDKRWYEPRNPQDFVRGRRDKIAVPDPRSEADDNFLTTNEVTTSDL